MTNERSLYGVVGGNIILMGKIIKVVNQNSAPYLCLIGGHESRQRNCFLKVILLSLITIALLHARTISFANTQWFVKSGYGGPGANYWSDSEENVWVDANGWLHLKIRYVNGIWYCSEVYTTGFTQYGMHRFYVIARLDSLDRDVVFALFIYTNDTTEIDIEFSEWGQIIPSYNAQYVIQPGWHSGNLEHFWILLNGDYTTHYFYWQADSIRFKSIHGHYQEPPNPGFLIHEWLYTGDDIPLQSESLRIHINLWLYQGNPPSNGQEVEVVVKDADLPPVLGLKGKSETKIFQPSVVGNYPNPIVTETVIKYSVSEETIVTLKLFDIMGKEIATLLHKNQKPGYYQVNCDIRNVSEKQLPNGVYFYQLTAGDWTSTKKMVIVR